MMSRHDAPLTLLSIHADKMNEGQESAARFLRRQAPLAHDLLALISLAQRLKDALTPLAAPEPFRSQLHHDLLSHSDWSRRPLAPERRWRISRRPLYYSLAAVGSVLPLLGIVVWRRRRRASEGAEEQGEPHGSELQSELLAPSACDKMHTR